MVSGLQLLLFSAASAGMLPSVRTAELSDSWLVLYNYNVADSVTWAQWYANQWGIPSQNLLGLNASSDEHLADEAAAQTQIFQPVNDFLAANPQIAERIMGFVVGYRVPGHYGTATFGVGGLSIACSLQYPTSTTYESNPDNPHMAGYILPPGGRLTRATMTPGRYMCARIDAMDLQTAKAITQRAQTIRSAATVMPGYYVYYDYTDSVLPSSTWYWLKATVQNSAFAYLPWRSFDDDTQQTPSDSFRLGAHDTVNWNNTRLRGTPAGPRILAYNLNSWGATTVRSITAESGRYVPNAIDAGFAAAIGATGEPGSVIGPFPDTLLAGLHLGWTLGESYYLAAPHNNWMWTLVGDPFLVVPDWHVNAPTGLGPMDFIDGTVTLATVPQLQFNLSDGDPAGLLSYHLQIDDSGDFSSPLVDFTSASLPQGPAAFTVGQDPQGGYYTAGFQGQSLAIGSRYYWRVAGNDGEREGPWAMANNGSTAFLIVEPVQADFDRDGDVDGPDFITFAVCYRGSNTPPAPSCATLATDLDGDGDVDGLDFLTFSNCHNGSDRPPRAGCQP
jgi:uncharacterized protein (TIGR03790 family)